MNTTFPALVWAICFQAFATALALTSAVFDGSILSMGVAVFSGAMTVYAVNRHNFYVEEAEWKLSRPRVPR